MTDPSPKDPTGEVKPPGTAGAVTPKPAKAEAKAVAPEGPPDPPPPADLAVPAAITALQRAMPDAVEQVSYWVGDWTVIVSAPHVADVCRFLRDSPEGAFDYCSDVTAADWPPRERRFDVIYCLYSTRLRHRLRVKTRAAEGEPVPTVTGVWPAANWLEREVWDLFGVNIVGHPDRRRILMPEEWQGHPQRKDYPLEGPGEHLMENPQDWLRIRNIRDEAGIE